MNYTIVINGTVWGGAVLYYYIDARKWFVGMCANSSIRRPTQSVDLS